MKDYNYAVGDVFRLDAAIDRSFYVGEQSLLPKYKRLLGTMGKAQKEATISKSSKNM